MAAVPPPGLRLAQLVGRHLNLREHPHTPGRLAELVVEGQDEGQLIPVGPLWREIGRARHMLAAVTKRDAAFGAPLGGVGVREPAKEALVAHGVAAGEEGRLLGFVVEDPGLPQLLAAHVALLEVHLEFGAVEQSRADRDRGSRLALRGGRQGDGVGILHLGVCRLGRTALALALALAPARRHGSDDEAGRFWNHPALVALWRCPVFARALFLGNSSPKEVRAGGMRGILGRTG